MIFFELFYVFFTIGLFCFGGGYAILPFIQDSVVGRGWITMHEFGDIIAVAESTPGPVSINTATFVGYKLAGIPGAVCATASLCLPAFVLLLTVVKLLQTERGERIRDRLLVGIHPVVVGMIFFAGWTIGQTVFFHSPQGAAVAFNPMALAVALISLVLSVRLKVNPILIIFVSALAGLGLQAL